MESKMPRYKHILGKGNVQYTPEEEAEADAQVIADQKIRDEYAKVKYKDDRKMSYPDIGDQLDDLYKKGAFSDDMTAKIKAVKDANPKPE